MTYMLVIEWRDQTEWQSNTNIASKKILLCINKNLGSKSLELSNLKFSGKLFVNESMSWKSALTLTQLFLTITIDLHKCDWNRTIPLQ